MLEPGDVAGTGAGGAKAGLWEAAGGWAMIVAGLIWIGLYVVKVVAPLVTSVDVRSSWSISVLRPVVIVLLGFGVVGLYIRLGGRSKGLGICGLVLGATGALAAVAGLALGVNILLGIATLCALAGLALVAGASLRARTLPRGTAILLLWTGILTFPLMFVTVFLGGLGVPERVYDDLVAGLAGVALVIGGRAVLRE